MEIESVKIHVAMDGRDDTRDGSAAKPYASLERAAQGAATHLRSGMYIYRG